MRSEQQLPLSEHANVSCCCCFWTFSKEEANHLEKAGRVRQRRRFSSGSLAEVVAVKSRPPCQADTHLCWWALTHQALSNNCWLDMTSESGVVKGWAKKAPYVSACHPVTRKWFSGLNTVISLSNEGKKSAGRLEKLMYMFDEWFKISLILKQRQIHVVWAHYVNKYRRNLVV